MTRGPLIAIGGHEEKEGDRVILRAIARAVGDRPLVLAPLASREPDEYIDTYRAAFADLLPREPQALADDPGEAVRQLDEAGGVFFTGGDQRRLLEGLRDAGLVPAVAALHKRGAAIAGTSAGATALGARMLLGAPGDESYRVGAGRFEDGLGLLADTVVDQHFAERGRIGRLMGAVAADPALLGLGVDENTALVTDADGFEVIGAGAVWVVDGTEATHTTIDEADPEQTLSIFDVRTHVLSAGDRFDRERRRPIARDADR